MYMIILQIVFNARESRPMCHRPCGIGTLVASAT